MVKLLRIIYYRAWFLTFMGHIPFREIYESCGHSLNKNAQIDIGKHTVPNSQGVMNHFEAHPDFKNVSVIS